MKQSKNTTFQGEIVTKVMTKTLTSGKFSQSFSIRTAKGELINCVVWSTYIDDSCNPALLDMGKNILVKGFWGTNKETNQPTGDLTLKWFGEIGADDTKKTTWNENVIKLYGGRTTYLETQRKIRAEKDALGLVQVRDGRWLKRKFAIEHKDEWKDRMDYLCDVLGEKYVCDQVRNISHETNVGLANLLNTGKAPGMGKPNISRYEASLEVLIKEAKDKEGVVEVKKVDERLPEDYLDGCPF